jgi:hypothetical protein
MNRYTDYRHWWCEHGANHSAVTNLELQFCDHINAMTPMELFNLLEDIEAGVYSPDAALAGEAFDDAAP